MSRATTAAALSADRRPGEDRSAASSANPLYWIAPALVAAAVYLGSLGNGFVWDDPLVLAQLRVIQGPADLVIVPRGIPHLYYRPVVFASYLVDRGLGGERPFWFHLSVVAWHVLATVLVFFLAQRLFRAAREGPLFAAVAALLFAVHPAHVESVAWMAGRSDVIACAFLLGSLLLYLRETTASAWLAGLLFLLALLTKEPVALAAAVYPLADASLGRAARPARWLPIAAAAGAYLALRAVGVGLLGEATQTAGGSIGDVFTALGVYLGKSLLPLRQTVFYDAVPASVFHLALGAVGLAALISAFVWGWQKREAAVVVPLAWFATTIAPALLLLLRRIASAPLAERYTYVPSVGVVLLAAYLLMRLAERTHQRNAVLAITALVALVAAAAVVQRNRVWENDVNFWTAAAEASTDAMPQRELADALLRTNQIDQAEAAYQLALQRPASPEERAMTYSNLGSLLSRGPRVDESIALFQKAIELRQHPTFYHGLGLALMRRAERAQAARDQAMVSSSIVQARQAFERAIALGNLPNAPSAWEQWQPAKTHLLLGQVLVALGEKDQARRHLQASLQLEPTGLTAETARKFLAMLGPTQ